MLQVPAKRSAWKMKQLTGEPPTPEEQEKCPAEMLLCDGCDSIPPRPVRGFDCGAQNRLVLFRVCAGFGCLPGQARDCENDAERLARPVAAFASGDGSVAQPPIQAAQLFDEPPGD